MPQLLCKLLFLSAAVCLPALNRVQADEPTTAAFVEQLIGGTWQLEGSEGTQDTYTSILGGKFTLFTSTGYTEQGRTLGVVGKHPTKNAWTWWVFRETGSVEVLDLNADRHAANEILPESSQDDGRAPQLRQKPEAVPCASSTFCSGARGFLCPQLGTTEDLRVRLQDHMPFYATLILRFKGRLHMSRDVLRL